MALLNIINFDTWANFEVYRNLIISRISFETD